MGKVRYYAIQFVRMMLVLAFIGAYLNERWLVLFVSGFAFLVSFLPILLEKKWGVKIPADIEVMIILFIYGSLFFGEVKGFYARFWWWDILLNLGASIALGLVGLTILYVLYKDEQLDASPVIIAIFTFTFAFAAGSLWEIFEYTIDQFFGFNLQGASLTDTMTDLIVNTAGALIVAVTGYIYIKDGKNNLFSKLIVNFIEKNPLFFRKKKEDNVAQKLTKLISKGESDELEFKATLRTNLHTNNSDKKIEHSTLKTITAFLNSRGGNLLLGVWDNGEVTGIEKDNFENTDKFMLHLSNLIKSQIGKEFFSEITIEQVKVEEKIAVKVNCRKSDKPVFLKVNGEEEFYIRNGPATVILKGSAMVDYIERRFKKQ